jgi:zinc transporter ZupT
MEGTLDSSSHDWWVQASILLIPAAIMTLGENLTCGVEKAVQAASQNLSAGIIMGALSSEIQPLMMSIFDESYSASVYSRFLAMLAVVCGSMLAMWTNFFVASLAEDEEDKEEGEGEAGAWQVFKMCPCLGIGESSAPGGDDADADADADAKQTELTTVTGGGGCGGGRASYQSVRDSEEGGAAAYVESSSGVEKPTPRRGPENNRLRGQRIKGFPSMSKNMNKAVVDQVMAKIRASSAELERNGGEDRSAFDDLVHGMERDIHRLLREVSSTPDWTADERRRVQFHVRELVESIDALEDARVGIASDSSSSSSSSSTLLAATSSSAAALSSSKSATSPGQRPSSPRGRTSSGGGGSGASELLVRQISDVEACLEHLHEHVERSTIKTWGPIMARGHWSALVKGKKHGGGNHSEAEMSDHHGGHTDHSSDEEEDVDGDFSRKPRLVLIFTVTVDAFVDGFLIGLCLVSNFPTAFIMAVATSLEMGFLGLAYGSTLNRDLDRTLAAILSGGGGGGGGAASASSARAATRLQLSIPPVVMVLAGALGVSLGEALQQNALLFLGMLSFASVSLIFLVTQELLVEARESIESPADLQCVTIWLFVGLFVAFFMSTVTDRG